MNWDSLRLSRLTLPAKLLVTLFLLLVGPGYLFGMANILLKHQNADKEPGLSVDDLRRTFHGMEKEVTPDAEITVNSIMLEQVRPGGDMREHLEEEGEPAIRGLVTWLEEGAKEEDFAKAGLAVSGDPSAESVMAPWPQPNIVKSGLVQRSEMKSLARPRGRNQNIGILNRRQRGQQRL